MTPKQRTALDFIRQYLAVNGHSPKYEEIAAAIGVKSKSNVHAYVYQLVKRGFITLVPGCRRSIRLVQ